MRPVDKRIASIPWGINNVLSIMVLRKLEELVIKVPTRSILAVMFAPIRRNIIRKA